MKKTSQTLAALLASAAACFAAPPQATTPAPAELAWPSEIPADCPIPKSATFGGILFTGRHAEYTNADTWYPSWAADGKLYSPYTDGTVTVPGPDGKPVTLKSWSGGKESVVGHAVITGENPLELNISEPGLIKGSPAPYGGRYPCANLHHDGVWYIGSYAVNHAAGGIAWGICGPFAGFHISKDNGKSWTPSPRSCAPGKGVFPEPAKLNGPVRFAVPHVVDFGNNMKHSPDGMMYLVAHGATQAEGVDRKANCGWLTGDQVYLCRVRPAPETVNDGSAYEYFAGHDAAGKPVWARELAKSRPILDWNNRCGNVSITYNPPLKKYLMCVSNADDTMGKDYNTFILESDAITGPWKIVTYLKAFGTQAYFVNIPSKFISSDGQTMWLCYSASWTDVVQLMRQKPLLLKANPPGSSYAMCLREFRLQPPAVVATLDYQGRWVEGAGDKAVLEAVDAAVESTQVSAKMACLPLLYKRDWDGFVEGPPWPCWWIQNSFGASYAMMPFLGEPYATWLEHSQGLWFRLMGDGKHKDVNGFIGPDGCLCDAAFVWMNGGSKRGFGDPRKPGGAVGQENDGKIHSEGIWYRQGDGNPKQHDWFMGTTAAGLILESDRLLVRHDVEAAKKRLPQLERVAAFLDSRRDPKTNLLKGAMASNLLAPGYTGIRQLDGTFGQAYLTELSINYIAGIERLAEVSLLCGEPGKTARYRETAATVRKALPRMMTPAGYFVMSEDPDGTRHGVFGAAKHGYFEATPNHDAGCFGITDDATNRQIIQRMLTLKGAAAPGGLAPHGLIIPNYPGYDDSVHGGKYGHWVNGGHWTTTQARMSIASLRADEFAHPFGAWAKIRALMEGYRADAPLPQFGQVLWEGKGDAPYCVVYDCWGASGGLLRGLFEYDYRADRLRVRPHLPASVTRYVQKFPVYFGKTRIYLTVTGSGECGWTELRPTGRAETLAVEITRGTAKAQGAWKPSAEAQQALLDELILAENNNGPAPTSGNDNPLRIGSSPSGENSFNGEFRDVRIYRRPLTGTEIGALSQGKDVEGALVRDPAAPNTPSHLVGQRIKRFLEYPASADIDFQENFTLAVSVRPAAMADNARLIDRATPGTMDGYLLDYLQGGKIVRLLTPWGVAQGPVTLEAGKWQHVAATCTPDGLMQVYFNGVKVAEAQGRRPAPTIAPAAKPVDFRKITAFYQALVAAGLQDSYEAAAARTALELRAAGTIRRKTTPVLPNLGKIPSCKLVVVEGLYFDTAAFIAGGLCDRLAGLSYWPEPVAPEIIAIARQEKLIPIATASAEPTSKTGKQ